MSFIKYNWEKDYQNLAKHNIFPTSQKKPFNALFLKPLSHFIVINKNDNIS